MNINEVINRTEKAFGLKEGEIYRKRRFYYIARVRMVAMYFLTTLYNLSYMKLAKIFGMDHATAMHAKRRVQTSDHARN
jgi:chromosomal replication initiation ATPase DnaA